MNNKNKVLAIFFSMCPGAGHMYLGYLRQGMQLMCSFFLLAFAMCWLNLDMLIFLLPVVWFYSIFSTYHLLEKEIDTADGNLEIMQWLKPKWLGIGLIFMGTLTLFYQLAAPFIDGVVLHYIQTGFAAAVLICFGMKLLLGSKENKIKEELN